MAGGAHRSPNERSHVRKWQFSDVIGQADMGPFIEAKRTSLRGLGSEMAQSGKQASGISRYNALIASVVEQTLTVSVFAAVHRTGNSQMPYTRPIRRFYLTAPRVVTFVVSIVLALLALLIVYGHVAQLHGINGFLILLIAYVVLLAGTLLRGV